MKHYIDAAVSLLGNVEGLPHVVEDTGQLDEYSSHPPVAWPCCLVDVEAANFSDIGQNRTAKPVNRQEGAGLLVLTFGMLQLTNNSAKAPRRQRDQALSLHVIIQRVHEALHGNRLTQSDGRCIRASYRRIKRSDGIQQIRVVYSFSMHNV